MTDAWFVLRCLDYVFFGGVLSGLIARWRHLHVVDWPGFRVWLWVFFASTGYATAESMWRGVPGGPRLVFVTVGLAGLFVGCYLPAVRRLRRSLRERRRGA